MSMSMTRGPQPLARFAAELDLKRLHPVEQRLRREIGAGQRAGVNEPVLIGLPPGRRAVETRNGGELDPRLAPERTERATQRASLVANVAAERQGNVRPRVRTGLS